MLKYGAILQKNDSLHFAAQYSFVLSKAEYPSTIANHCLQ